MRISSRQQGSTPGWLSLSIVACSAHQLSTFGGENSALFIGSKAFAPDLP
jgi:hypothetical protein